MTLSSLLKDYCTFNVWANTEFVNWLHAKPMELMEQEMPSSFPSIRATLLHTWGAEKIWLERLQKVPTTTFLSLAFEGSTTDIFEGMLKTSGAFSAFVQGLSDDDLKEVCHFKLLNGTEDSRPRAQMIHHCMNHSTYHRGQLVTMGRGLGLTDPPSTDFIKYVRLSTAV